MRLTAAIVLVIGLAGCAEMMESVDTLDRAVTETVYGDAAMAVTLAPYPQDSKCSDSRCRELDQLEAQLYASARGGRISWTQLVDDCYRKRAELFPSVQDAGDLRELRAYQRALAEPMDQHKVTESQWVYLNERKVNELQSRNR